jgi:hypothetical protein
MSDLICPYCFRSWSRSTAAFRCQGAPEDPKCPRVEDRALEELTGQPEVRKKVITKTARFGRAFDPPKGGVVCECGARTVAVCPNCHYQLPHAYAQGGDQLIGMVGTKASGKSHVIAVLFHELFERVGASYSARVEMLDDDTRERVRTQLLPRIYDQGVVLESTVTAAVDDRVRRPLGMRLRFGQSQDAVNTVFFDTAGEDLVHDGAVGREARYIGRCGALILLIDPLQIQLVRDAIGTSVPLPDQIVDPSVIVKNVTELMRAESGIKAPKKLTQPLAIAFSKLDAIQSLFEEGSPVLAEPPATDRYDAAAARSLSALLRAHVVQWLGPEFDQLVSSNYEKSCYFGISALGSQPVEGGRLERDVVPHRIADPLLWILSEWNAIPTAK